MSECETFFGRLNLLAERIGFLILLLGWFRLMFVGPLILDNGDMLVV